MRSLLIITIALLAGVCASQFPEYAQQYRQRVGGAVVELEKIVVQFDADAGEFGLNRQEALERYVASQDEFLNLRGKSMSEIIARYEFLSAHYTRLTEAAPFARLWVFAKERDNEIARDTLDIYEPAVPATSEGAVHAAGGFGAVWLFLSALFGRRRKTAEA